MRRAPVCRGNASARRARWTSHAARALAPLTLLACGVGAGPVAALGGPVALHRPTLGPDGIGTVRFGSAKPTAVAELIRLFGAPSAQGVNTACGPRYTEVEWHDLVAEFRLGRLSGFRYLAGGWPLTTPGSPRETPSRAVSPRLATARGISLGDTVARLRGAYGVLHLVGTDRWRSDGGLVFVDGAARPARPLSRRIIEIKLGTCGDF